MRRWKEHFLIRKAGSVACLDCGKYGRDSQGPLGKWKRKWLQEPCAGFAKIPKPLLELLRAGTFDYPSVRTNGSWVEVGVLVGGVAEHLSERLRGANVHLAH